MPSNHTPFALVVDDDPIIQMDTSTILEDAGFRVYEASNVAEALQRLEQASDSIQLLFTDVQMPPEKLDGFHLARVCAERWPHIGVLVASGVAKPKPGDMPVGAVFISKPFSADIVYAHLVEILPDGAKPEPLKRAAARFA